MLEALKNRFTKYGLELHPDKTRRGYFKVGRKISAKKFRAKVKDLNLWLKSVRNRVLTKDWWNTLGLKPQGHFAK